MSRSIEITRHESDLGRWESVVAAPHPALRPFVREYVGGSESTTLPLVRRELPTEIAPVIFNFGAPFRVFDSADPSRFVEQSSFATGAFDSYVLVGSTGSYSCLQVNFTILGARFFLGMPLRALANQVIALDEVLSARGTPARRRSRQRSRIGPPASIASTAKSWRESAPPASRPR